LITPRRADLIAGVSVAGLMLPEAVAYAGIAGLPPQRAVLAAIAGSLLYALAGRSRFAIVSPTSSSAAILGAVLAVVPGDTSVKLALATIAVGTVSLCFLAAAFLRLGTLTGFVSRPVLRGFAFGLAITIILRQMPVIAGIALPGTDIFHLAWLLATSLPRWHPESVATGIVALLALLALRRLPAVPGAFIVLAGGIAASMALDLPAHGVATVGSIDLLAMPTMLPHLNWDVLSHLTALVLPLVLVLFAESWGTVRTLALRNGDRVEPNRELAAFGFANLGAALVQGMPVGAGFSAGSASETAGAATRWTAVVGAVGLAVLVIAGASLVAQLPEPVLAAVVIAALTHALDPAPLLRLWKLRRDSYVATGAAAGVLVFGVVDGMVLAIGLSLVALLHRMATPRIVRLGRLGDGHDYVDVARHPDATLPDAVAVWRPAVPLFFANAEQILTQIAERLAGEPAIRIAVVSLEETYDLDTTALDALLEFDTRMRALKIRVQLARVRDGVRDLIKRAGAADLLTRISFSVDDAVAAAKLPGKQGQVGGNDG
jgi:MFS superfamily sulfate permease-like transporter